MKEVRHLDVGVAALLLGAQDVGDHLGGHGGVQVHVLHLRHVEMMSPARVRAQPHLALVPQVDGHPDAGAPALVPLLVKVPAIAKYLQNI